MIRIKTAEDIEKLREGGKHHAEILNKLAAMVKPGISSIELDDEAENLVREYGDKPAFLGYRPENAKTPFPATLCLSVNEVIVHGIPNKEPVILKEGDIVTLDLGLIHEGLITDAAITVKVGKVDKEASQLIEATREALYQGIKAVKPGRHVGDIGAAIERYAQSTDFYLADDLAGHGVGYEVHEEPYVPNWGEKNTGPELVPGLVIAIEPMLCVGNSRVSFDKDGYTVRTKSGGLSAHFEHTVLVTEDGYEILTKL